MQIAIQARDGFVFASDTRIRTGADRVSVRAAPDAIVGQSKVRISKRHNVAVGLSGLPKLDADPLQEFVDYISGLIKVPDDLGEAIDGWGNEYQKRHGQGWAFQLLIVNPNSDRESIWKVQVTNELTQAPGLGYRVNGNETNGAIIWPEYCKCDSVPPPDVETAVNIAALTILTGSELSSGVAGLEIWRYTDAWRRADRSELNAIGDRFKQLKNEIAKFIHAG